MELAALNDSTDMLSKFVGSLFVLKDIYSFWNNDEKIKALADTVNCVRGVLSDLQRIQTPNESVTSCYNRLREVFLDAEDFLDRVQTMKKKEDYEARMMKQAEAKITLKRPGQLSLSHARHKMMLVGKTGHAA